MLEPDVTLTDYAIFLECMLFCGLLARPRTRRVDRAAYIQLFLLTGLAALTGGTMHGFFAVHSEGPASALWVLTLLLIGGASVALWIAAAQLWLGGPGARIRRRRAATAGVFTAAHPAYA